MNKNTFGFFEFKFTRLGVAACTLFFASVVCSHEQSAGRADSHAPIGVMGDHTHKAGEFMVSFRHMEMSMSGNLQGSSDISDDEIATTIANRFAMMDGMPPTLRIVPQDMTTTMDMLGVMYAPSDRITLMLMLNYLSKDMRLKTYAGMSGTDIRGFFNTSTSGLGDTKVSALVSLKHTPEHKVHLNLGMNLPTGEIDFRDQILSPMTMTDGSLMYVDMRLPYAMQLGSGSYDFEPGVTYSGMAENFSWGAQYKAVLRLNDNSEGYRLGDQHQAQLWGQYLFQPAVSASVRMDLRSIGQIDGIDENIMGPVQTADPDNYGGDYAFASIGVNYLGQESFIKNHRLALEYSFPVLQDVNGVQMSMDHMFTIGYQYAF